MTRSPLKANEDIVVNTLRSIAEIAKITADAIESRGVSHAAIENCTVRIRACAQWVDDHNGGNSDRIPT